MKIVISKQPLIGSKFIISLVKDKEIIKETKEIILLL